MTTAHPTLLGCDTHSPTPCEPWPNPFNPAAVRSWLDRHTVDPAAVRDWAAPLLRAAEQLGPVPLLGAPAWWALPDTDPRKWAAIITTAVARLVETTPAAVAMRLRRELLAEDRAVAERLKAASMALSAAQDWTTAANRPTHAELCRRRNTTPGRAA